jgi:hypothetical protein
MTALLSIEEWAVIAAAVGVGAAAALIRIGWRRGKGMGDR